MAVSKRDKEIFAKQAEFLRQHERPEGAQVTGEQRRRTTEWMNALRARDGMPPLINDEDEHPEHGFHRIAVARGLAR